MPNAPRLELRKIEEERSRYKRANEAYAKSCQQQGVTVLKAITSRLTSPEEQAVCVKTGCWLGVEEDQAEAKLKEHPFTHVCRDADCTRRSEKHLSHMLSHIHLNGLIFNTAHIRLCKSQVHALSEALTTHGNVSELRANQCNLKGSTAALLLTSLTRSENITVLEMYNNEMSPVSLPYETLCVLFQRLRSVKLSGNPLGFEGVSTIAKAIRNTVCSLSEIYLNDVGMPPKGARVLTEALAAAPTVKILSCRNNSLDALSCCYFSDLLASKKTIYCGDCSEPIGSIHKQDEQPHAFQCCKCGFETMVPDALFRSLERNLCNLSEVHLRGNAFGDSGAEYLSDKLCWAGTLTSLELKDCKLTSIGIACLIRNVSPSLTALNLNGNTICDEGVTAIAAQLNNLNLKTLGLQCVGVTEKGGICLSNALRKDTTIHGLDISGNDLGDGFARHIAETLDVNTSLGSLDIHECGITQRGSICIAASLRDRNRSVTHVDFSKNVSSSQGAAVWAEVILRNKNLVRLSLTNNKLDLFAVSDIISALHENTTLVSIHLFCTAADPRANLSTPETRKYLHSRRTVALPILAERFKEAAELQRKRKAETVACIASQLGTGTRISSMGSMPTLLSLASSVEV
eukprot:TRINITY_DN4130_c5_g1_i1.p1 TRINITY_DN4130_c5_g1~~TRINITY_DN4130_c5_g1_i1.p1  ORF type:complete len:650 (+),score=52.52 TRINITY_DN4130_c5_g1_i1:63-1952(+)